MDTFFFVFFFFSVLLKVYTCFRGVLTCLGSAYEKGVAGILLIFQDRLAFGYIIHDVSGRAFHCG